MDRCRRLHYTRCWPPTDPSICTPARAFRLCCAAATSLQGASSRAPARGRGPRSDDGAVAPARPRWAPRPWRPGGRAALRAPRARVPRRACWHPTSRPSALSHWASWNAGALPPLPPLQRSGCARSRMRRWRPKLPRRGRTPRRLRTTGTAAKGCGQAWCLQRRHTLGGWAAKEPVPGQLMQELARIPVGQRAAPAQFE